VRRERSLEIAAGLFAATIIAIALTCIFEIDTFSAQGREGRAAANDPWLVLGRVLSGTHEVSRYSALKDVDFSSAALVVADGADFADVDASARKDGKAARIPDWVSAGGRLVISWASPPDEDDQIELPDFPALVPERSDGTGSGRARGVYRGSPVDVEARSYVDFSKATGPKGIVRLCDGPATRIALQIRGKGWALAGASPLFMENRRLADPSDLGFSSALLGDLPKGKVWLPAPPPTKAIPAKEGLLAKEAFVPVAAAAFLFCLALLWYCAPRLGPVIPEPSADRRGLMERFRAEGRFLFVHRADASILDRAGAVEAPAPDAGARRGSRARAERIVRAIDARVENDRSVTKEK
jgi:hypothetical protein